MMFKKALVLFVFLSIFNVNTSFSEDGSNTKNEDSLFKKYLYTKKYNRITFDLSVGAGYGYYDFQTADFRDASVPTEDGALVGGKVTNFAIGIDFYLGGYYDEFFKAKREYLLTPFIGVQLTKLLHKYKGEEKYHNKHEEGITTTTTDYNAKSEYTEDYAILLRLGMVAKLKYDINVKPYFLLGLSFNRYKYSDEYHWKYDAEGTTFYGTSYSSHSFSDQYNTVDYKGKDLVIGGGIDIVIKQMFLIGVECRSTFHKNVTINTNDGMGHEYFQEARGKNDIYVSGKIGIVF